jgi:hypothetical protein
MMEARSGASIATMAIVMWLVVALAVVTFDMARVLLSYQAALDGAWSAGVFAAVDPEPPTAREIIARGVSGAGSWYAAWPGVAPEAVTVQFYTADGAGHPVAGSWRDEERPLPGSPIDIRVGVTVPTISPFGLLMADRFPESVESSLNRACSQQVGLNGCPAFAPLRSGQ